MLASVLPGSFHYWGMTMTYSHACTRCAQMGSSAVVTAALAMSLVTAPPERISAVSIESNLVQAEVALTSAVLNTASAVALSEVQPAAATAIEATGAATTDDPNAIPRTIAQVLLTGAGLAVSPLWYLGFPVTIPLMFAVGFSAFPGAPTTGEVGAWASGFRLIIAVGGWLLFPFVVGSLASVIFPLPTETTLATSSAAARSSASILDAATETTGTTDPEAAPPGTTKATEASADTEDATPKATEAVATSEITESTAETDGATPETEGATPEATEASEAVATLENLETTDAPASPPQRSSQALRNGGSLRASLDSATGRPKQSTRSAPAVQSPNRSKATQQGRSADG